MPWYRGWYVLAVAMLFQAIAFGAMLLQLSYFALLLVCGLPGFVAGGFPHIQCASSLRLFVAPLHYANWTLYVPNSLPIMGVLREL